MADDSPIEQVRLTVPPTLQVLTIRTWLVGIPLCILQTVLVRIGIFRRQLISISSVCIDISLLIVGNLLAKVLPEKSVRMPGTRWNFSLNPGPFNIKEHVATSILVNSRASPGFLNISIAKIFYRREIQLWPAVLLVTSTQARKFPLFSTNIYDSTGHTYDVSRIVDPNTLLFDSEAYNNYSKVYYSTSLIYTIGFCLALYTSTISHIALFYGRSLWHQFKKAYKDEEQDVHARLMKQNYESVPQWWFYSMSLSMIGMAILFCEGFGGQIQLRYWELLLACAVVLLFLPLEGVLSASTGKPLGNMAFRLYGSEAQQMAAGVIATFKLTHYMKFVGTTCSCFVDFGVAWWMLHSVNNICQPELLPIGSPWTCPSERATYISGVTWGLIGPSKIFYPHGMYSSIFIFALIGLVAPIPLWLLSHKYPEKKWITLVNFPIVFGVASAFSLGGLAGYWSWFAVGLLFNYFIFHKYKKWWARYNYVLSAGLNVGSAFCIVLLSLSLQLFEDVYGVNWWGLDSDHCPLAKCPTVPGVVIEGCPMIK
ncbi:hypothetical protein ZIOFF_013213 [Zingiber officinale]|uniref:Uncharacterized protein n=1 Tax=Zingiber officinale TaxID=94328 RepID=A0A8J5HZB1_ZINOF|nr:hypothetical protein ZIOFF_013213 [Zingiber officinale]